VPVFIPHWRVQDIDSEDDWRRAELLRQVIQETA
jgi:N-acylneuraminate cytidylyltransferase